MASAHERTHPHLVRRQRPTSASDVSVRRQRPTSASDVSVRRQRPTSASDVSKIVAHYEKRWLIDQFHKALKTGCGIEHRRMGCLDNYLRVMAITMPIAVRTVRMQVLANLADVTIPATEVLSPPEIAVLWRKVEGTAPPEKSPSCLWAYRAIAKLAGWADSRRTGRIALDTLWRGVERLSALVEGWRLATEHER